MTKIRFSKTDKVFFTSDTHFGHNNIIKYCGRPFNSIEEMDETIINNWDSVVGKDDYIFHLGDFCFGGADKWKYYLNQLNGKKYLILGNHDFKNYPRSQEYQFENVSQQMLITIGNYKLVLNHYPFLTFPGYYHNKIFQLFGHVHSGGRPNVDSPRLKLLLPTQYDVGVDNNNFKPVSFNEIYNKILDQQFNYNIELFKSGDLSYEEFHCEQTKILNLKKNEDTIR